MKSGRFRERRAAPDGAFLFSIRFPDAGASGFKGAAAFGLGALEMKRGRFRERRAAPDGAFLFSIRFPDAGASGFKGAAAFGLGGLAIGGTELRGPCSQNGTRKK
jgi:hypothetical protein